MSKTDVISKCIKIAIVVWLAASVQGAAQQADQANAYGGVTDIFDHPVGARAMALGGAYVSLADDPFALYWNPAALEQVPHMGLGFYYTNLAAGTSYNYVAYTHPTLFVGTFSVGMLNIATNDIKVRDVDDPSEIGVTNYGRTLLLFGYGFKPLSFLSVGANFKVERANLVGFPEALTDRISNYTESSYGADFGLLFKPGLKTLFLNDISIGLSVQNLLQRSIRAIESRETTPSNLRLGLSKKFSLGGESNSIAVAVELDKNEMTPMQLHMGAEYRYQEYAALRLGFDRDKLTYGMGARVAGVQIDYSYWTGNDALLGTSHRLSVVLHVGKNRQQRLEDYQLQEQQRIEKIEAERRESDRRDRISADLSNGERLFAKGDWDQAYVILNRLLVLYDISGSDPDLEVARELFARINKERQEKRNREEEEFRRLQDEEAQTRRNTKAATDHYNDALAFYTADEYHDAIREIDKALDYMPNSEQFQKLRKDAELALARKIDELLERAKTMQAAGRSNEAIVTLNEALRLARDNNQYKTFIIGMRDNISAGLSRDSMLRQAIDYENSKNWIKAAELYKQLANAEPGNAALRKKYEDTNARATARDMGMPDDVKALYNRGLQAAIAGRYVDALRYLEEARKLQPQNINIYIAIDRTTEQLKRTSASTGK